MYRKPFLKMAPVLAGVIMMAALFAGCGEGGLKSLFGKKYELIWDDEGFRETADKQYYREGETVRAICPYTCDQDAWLTADGFAVHPTGEPEDEHLVFEFPMPAHDVHVTWDLNDISDMIELVRDELEVCYESRVFTAEGSRVTAIRMFRKYDEVPETRIEYRNLDTGESDAPWKTVVVPDEAVDAVMDVIRENGLARFNDTEEIWPIDGIYYYCEFLNGIEYVTVTSDHMPENGERAFGAVCAALRSYIEAGK